VLLVPDSGPALCRQQCADHLRRPSGKDPHLGRCAYLQGAARAWGMGSARQWNRFPMAPARPGSCVGNPSSHRRSGGEDGKRPRSSPRARKR